ncbi:MAG: iron chaperone [Candidatus Limnocylindrales bacterium]
MTDKEPPATVIDARLAALPPDQRAALQHLRETIAAVAPEAVEAIGYGMPGFRYRGNLLVSYEAFKDHCSLFPMSGQVVEQNPELAAFAVAKGTYHFTPEEPIPDDLIAVVVWARMAEIDARPTK